MDELTKGSRPALATDAVAEMGEPAGTDEGRPVQERSVRATERAPTRWTRQPAGKRASQGTTQSGIAPSGCGCQQNGAAGGGLVYALGELGFDFGTQARQDAIDAEMDEGKFATNPRDLLEFLTRDDGANMHFASAILWTLNHDGPTPFYVLHPEGAFARETYGRLLEFYLDQINGKAERVSVPGILDGSVSLYCNQQLPIVVPELRGFWNWKTEELIAAVAGKKPSAEGQKREYDAKVEGMRNFLERVYFEIRNAGQTPQERALNFAATNAHQLEAVFRKEAARRSQLDEIRVEPSPICRPDSDCWDVLLTFFNPQNVLGEAREAYRFTVDVSDVVPVLVGEMRTWYVR